MIQDGCSLETSFHGIWLPVWRWILLVLRVWIWTAMVFALQFPNRHLRRLRNKGNAAASLQPWLCWSRSSAMLVQSRLFCCCWCNDGLETLFRVSNSTRCLPHHSRTSQPRGLMVITHCHLRRQVREKGERLSVYLLCTYTGGVVTLLKFVTWVELDSSTLVCSTGHCSGAFSSDRFETNQNE